MPGARERFIVALREAAQAATEAAAAADTVMESRRLERVAEVLRAEQRCHITEVKRPIRVMTDFRRQA